MNLWIPTLIPRDLGRNGTGRARDDSRLAIRPGGAKPRTIARDRFLYLHEGGPFCDGLREVDLSVFVIYESGRFTKIRSFKPLRKLQSVVYLPVRIRQRSRAKQVAHTLDGGAE